MTETYHKRFYFPGMGKDDLRQEILLLMYKAALYFTKEKGSKRKVTICLKSLTDAAGCAQGIMLEMMKLMGMAKGSPPNPPPHPRRSGHTFA